MIGRYIILKILVSDFDNSLYMDGQISPENLQFIQSFQEKGHRFIIATGRCHQSLFETMESFALSPDCLILNNGALIISPDFSHRFLMKKAKEKAHRLKRKFKIKRFQVLTGYEEIPLSSMSSLDWEQGVCSFYLNFSDKQEQEAAYHYLSTWPDVKLMQEGLNIDVLAAHVDKAEAIAFLKKHYAWKKKDIITVGDGYNDLLMIEAYNGVLLSKKEARNPQSLARILKKRM